MYYDFQNFIDNVGDWIVTFYHSPVMFVIKLFAAVYLLVIFIDVVLMLILLDVPSQVRTGLKGVDIPVTSKNKMLKRWEKVKERLKTGNLSQYKVAVIEADAIADEILSGIGYKGANMMEKLEQVSLGHLDDHLEALKGVHKIRNRIIHEADFQIDDEMAKAVIGVYENFLKYLELL